MMPKTMKGHVLENKFKRIQTCQEVNWYDKLLVKQTNELKDFKIY